MGTMAFSLLNIKNTFLEVQVDSPSQYELRRSKTEGCIADLCAAIQEEIQFEIESKPSRNSLCASDISTVEMGSDSISERPSTESVNLTESSSSFSNSKKSGSRCPNAPKILDKYVENIVVD